MEVNGPILTGVALLWERMPVLTEWKAGWLGGWAHRLSGRLWRRENFSPFPEFEPRAAKPIASRCTDYTTPSPDRKSDRDKIF